MPIEEVVTIHCYLGQRCVTVNSLRDGIVLWELHHHCSSRQLLSMIPMTIMLLKLSFFFVADPCHCYSYLSETNRNTKHRTWVFEFRALYCDNQLAGGWYRFVGAAGARMPTMRVPAYRCGADLSGWFMTAHPIVEDSEIHGTVYFSNRPSFTPLCKYSTKISVKNCGSYFILKLSPAPTCDSRYCGTK